MKSQRKRATITNLVLFVWFFLDMTGLFIGSRLLVSQAYREDGIYFLIFTACLIAFWLWKRGGAYVLSAWLALWFLAQVSSHWVPAIFGPWEQKIQYFEGTIKLFASDTVYIPDLYHIILHLLILLALIFTLLCFPRRKRNIEQSKPRP